MRRFVLGALIVTFSIVVLFFGGVKKAEAITLKISNDGFSTNAVDVFSASGGVSYNSFASGGIGNFDVVFTGGSSYPTLGAQNHPQLDLSSLNVSSSSGGGTLDVALTQTGFNTSTVPAITGFRSWFGGGTSGSVDFTFLIGTDNDTDWTDDTKMASWTGLGTHPFSGSDMFFPTTMPTGDFSLTILARITHGAGDSTSFNAAIEPVPEPGTIALLGIGLAGLVGVGVRRRAKKKDA